MMHLTLPMVGALGLNDVAICLSVCMSLLLTVYPMPLGQIITIHIRAIHYYIGLTGNPMLEDEPAVKGPKRQRSRRRRDIVSPRDTLLIIVVAGAYPAS